MQFLEDIISFVKSLSMIDIILYFAVLVLIILIISLIYVIKTSEEENDEEEKKPHQTISFPKFKIKQEEEKETKDAIDLKDIVSTIDELPKPIVDMNVYETEQEEKAIISYDELVNTSKFHPINYDTDELIDNEVRVKKVNLEQITNPNINEEPPKVEVKLFQYEREEQFLKTLQKLNELLN